MEKSGLFADDAAVSPNNEGQAESFVLGAELAGSAVLGTQGDASPVRKFGGFHRLWMLRMLRCNHTSERNRTTSEITWLSEFAKAVNF